MRNTPSKNGFTLIEMVVVVGIIGLLTAAVTLSLGKQRTRAREARRISDTGVISDAIQQYVALGNSAPSTNGSAVDVATALTPLVDAGVLSAIPSDPGPRATCMKYYYRSPGVNGFSWGLREYLVSFLSELVTTTGTHPMNSNLLVPQAPSATDCPYFLVYLLAPVS